MSEALGGQGKRPRRRAEAAQRPWVRSRRQALVAATLLCAVCGVWACAPGGSAAAGDPGLAAAPQALLEPRPEIFDSHVHLATTGVAVATALRIFDEAGIDRFAVKSAGPVGSPRYRETLLLAKALGPRMAYFVNVNWREAGLPDFGERAAADLERAVRAGASGVKVFKALGLGLRDEEGRLWPVDTPRLFPLWRKAGEVGAIVALHTGDPKAFFLPPNPANERWEELARAPQWSFYGKDYPSRDVLLAQRNALLERFPETRFLGIHLANNPEDLDAVAAWLERYPNLYVDTSARLGEIGRHPAQKVRDFFLRFQDRILFGSDLIVAEDGALQLGSVSLEDVPPGFAEARWFYDAHRRFFETGARGLAHPTPSQGRWTIDGIGLPPAVLAKVYRENADRLIFAPRRRWLAQHAAAAGGPTTSAP